MFYKNFLGHIGVLLQLQLLQFVFGLHTSSIIPLYYIYNIKFHFDFCKLYFQLQQLQLQRRSKTIFKKKLPFHQCFTH